MKYLLIFIPLFVFGQTNCSKIIYSVQPKQWENQKERDVFFDQMDALTKHIKYELIFDKEKSNFRYIKSLTVKENAWLVHQHAEMISKGSYLYMKDTIYKKEVFQNKLFYTYKIFKGFKWELLNEIKKIDQYICYKATRQIKITNSNGSFSFTIVAWYCPDLPFNYGPKDNFGLPGLILELEDTHSVFYVDKIELNSTACDFEYYNKNCINFEEFEKIKEKKSKK